MNPSLKLISAILLVIPALINAQTTEIKYLSGTGCDQTVEWKFLCTEGSNSGKQTTIPVPSNWELHGFGKYNYGHDKDSVRGKEKGLYSYEFTVPSEWKNKQVEIVFEGSMTDTEVKINGKSAGSIHKGAFYRFRYDIGKLLKYDTSSNLIEVTVAKHSSNTSVNKAERFADFWVFGGIFRPVYLEAKPLQNILRTAIDAKADGSFETDVYLKNIKSAGRLTAHVSTLKGENVGAPVSVEVKKGDAKVHLSGKISGINAWTPEAPALYNVTYTLTIGGKAIHQTVVRTGFRTVEVRYRDGIYVNGVKIKFKGVCHHTFWPETGRASSKKRSIEDVKMLKDMNMNAVRTSHYPPDEHFIDACDSLGIFVLDELAGWHDAYDTEIGAQLVGEMVIRDVNHPSVVVWDNGNEGGHNYDLDAVFAEYDIQKRPVIHPWQTFNGFDNQHYINYDYGAGVYWHGHEIVFPTEFLHGIYDGGLGAGLSDYWELMWKNPHSAGGFLWVFADEGVVRTDKNGEIDTDRDHAPDGIIGPFHEKEGSYYAIKKIWSPIYFEKKDITPNFDGTLRIENRYFYTNLKECHFKWTLSEMPLPNGNGKGYNINGDIPSPDIFPGAKGFLQINLPGDWRNYDVLYITATDPTGMEIATWSYPITLPSNMILKVTATGGKAATVHESASDITITAEEVQIVIDKKTGLLKKTTNSKGEIPFNNGPVLCFGEALTDSMAIKTDSDTVNVIFSYKNESQMKELIWSVFPSGLIRLDVKYNPLEYDSDFFGVSFSCPESEVKGVEWLGNGPFRVWKNRMDGGTLDVHTKDYNNTVTGVSPMIYPEFKGYHSQFYWAKLITKGPSFLMATATEDVFLRLYTPGNPENTYNTAPPFPPGDISFLQAIPAIGTKSQKPEKLGPSGQKNMYFSYDRYDHWRLRSLKMKLYFDFTAN
jgi:hypothetical protein